MCRTRETPKAFCEASTRKLRNTISLKRQPKLPLPARQPYARSNEALTPFFAVLPSGFNLELF
jgi:hypothetical protein